LKRLGIAISLLAGAFLLLMGLNGAPSRYVVETDVRELRDARREQYILLTREIAKASLAKQDNAALKRQLDDAMLEPEELRRGGWDVLILPPGATDPRGEWLVWGEVDVSEEFDPRVLLGPWRVRVRPRTTLARAARAVGFGP
jgi:hypothetical protein